MTTNDSTPKPQPAQMSFYTREWLRLARAFEALANDPYISEAGRRQAAQNARDCRLNAGKPTQ